MRGLERRSLAAFVQARRGVGGVENWQRSMPKDLWQALFRAAVRRACFASVFTSTLARDGRTDETLVWELFEPSSRRQVHRGFGPHYALLSFLLSRKTLLISRTRASLREPRRRRRVYRSRGPDDKTTIAENPDTKPSLLESH